MKKYIKSSKSDSSKYIGGKLEDIVEKYGYVDDGGEAEKAWVDRYKAMSEFVLNRTPDSYIIYRPDSGNYTFELRGNEPGLLDDVVETMSIKEGIDLIDLGYAIEVIADYGPYEDAVFLYPINDNKVGELAELIEDADFCESIVIENEIAQETWNGASVEDVLKSWA